ncbi:MAG: hypothetical protein OXU20_39720, partial [Myxococcales bacterium]|nr:hypothetical protein [Myxococcales bacterium]
PFIGSVFVQTCARRGAKAIQRAGAVGAGPEALIMISDGVPNDICFGGAGGDGSAQRAAVIAAIERAALAGVSTHVVGILDTDSALEAFLDEAAQHGAPEDPTAAAYLPGTPADLHAALDAIAAVAAACEP